MEDIFKDPDCNLGSGKSTYSSRLFILVSHLQRYLGTLYIDTVCSCLHDSYPAHDFHGLPPGRHVLLVLFCAFRNITVGGKASKDAHLLWIAYFVNPNCTVSELG